AGAGNTFLQTRLAAVEEARLNWIKDFHNIGRFWNSGDCASVCDAPHCFSPGTTMNDQHELGASLRPCIVRRVLMGDQYKTISFIFDVINQALFPPPLDRLLLQVSEFGRASELLELVQKQPFDLIVLNRTGICWDVTQNMPEILTALRLR